MLQLGGDTCYFCSKVVDQNQPLGSTEPQEDKNFSLRGAQKGKRTSCLRAALWLSCKQFSSLSSTALSHSLSWRTWLIFSQTKTKTRKCKFPQVSNTKSNQITFNYTHPPLLSSSLKWRWPVWEKILSYLHWVYFHSSLATLLHRWFHFESVFSVSLTSVLSLQSINELNYLTPNYSQRCSSLSLNLENDSLWFVSHPFLPVFFDWGR